MKKRIIIFISVVFVFLVIFSYNKVFALVVENSSWYNLSNPFEFGHMGFPTLLSNDVNCESVGTNTFMISQESNLLESPGISTDVMVRMKCAKVKDSSNNYLMLKNKVNVENYYGKYECPDDHPFVVGYSNVQDSSGMKKWHSYVSCSSVAGDYKLDQCQWEKTTVNSGNSRTITCPSSRPVLKGTWITYGMNYFTDSSYIDQYLCCNSSSSPVQICTPDCGDTSQKCPTETWSDGCTGTCKGTKNCSTPPASTPITDEGTLTLEPCKANVSTCTVSVQQCGAFTVDGRCQCNDKGEVDSIFISWEDSSTADAYKLFRVEYGVDDDTNLDFPVLPVKNGDFLINKYSEKRITSFKDTNAIDNKLNDRTIYRYRMQAYRLDNGEKASIKTDWSNEKEIMCNCKKPLPSPSGEIIFRNINDCS